jgi:FlaA1/EpsC-like NDP-sugar epimerase
MHSKRGGRIYVPKMPSYHLGDVAGAIAPDCEIREIGIRAGERLHECLITEAEAADTRDEGGHYIIEPGHGDGSVSALYSDKNPQWLTVADIRAEAGLAPQNTWVLTSGEMG